MSENEAGPSGRGGGGRGASKVIKGKFMPTVPGRRKKGEGAGNSAADEARRNDEFKDLIKAADSESKWQGGRGRGRRSFQHHEQRSLVAFGGGMEHRAGLAPAKDRSGGGKGGGTGGGGGGGGKGGGGGGGSKSGILNGRGEMDVDEGDKEELLAARKAEHKSKPVVHHDYTQYYPTNLPFSPPPFLREFYPSEDEEDEDGQQQALAQGPDAALSQASLVNTADLAMTKDRAGNAARQLHLLDPDDPESLFLVQLPTILPIQAPLAAHNGAKAGAGGRGGMGSRHAGASKPATVAGISAAAGEQDSGVLPADSGVLPAEECRQGDQRTGAGGMGGGMMGAGRQLRSPGHPTPEGSHARSLPSGKIGKLLVFKSGRVKLQMGDVLMDVSAGLPIAHRQDAAAINCSTGHCIFLGEVMRRMVISPDIYQLMGDTPVPEYEREDWAPKQQQLREAAAKAQEAQTQSLKLNSKIKQEEEEEVKPLRTVIKKENRGPEGTITATKVTGPALASISSTNQAVSLHGPSRERKNGPHKRLQRVEDVNVEPVENGTQGHGLAAEAPEQEQDAQGPGGEEDEFVAGEIGLGQSSEDADLMDYD